MNHQHLPNDTASDDEQPSPALRAELDMLTAKVREIQNRERAEHRATVLREAADAIAQHRGALNGQEWPQAAADLLRRMADGSQP